MRGMSEEFFSNLGKQLRMEIVEDQLNCATHVPDYIKVIVTDGDT